MKTYELLYIEVDKISFFESIIIYIIDIIVYSLMGIFIQLYRDYGINIKNFIKFLFIKKNIEIDNLLELNDIDDDFSSMNLNHQELSKVNKEKKAQNKILIFKNITKKFNELKAIDDFNAELFPVEIFCLLGNNGAGKTTLINIISGIIKPNNGDIRLNNRSLISDKINLYENVGLCEQENIFFDHLSVEEHLNYIYQIKKNNIN